MDAAALGRYLRESRESRELTLEDAVATLRIRRPILEAFERGEFAVGETTVQARGLLRNYARFLQLDEERVLQYYESAQDNDRRKRRRRKSKKSTQELTAPRKITDTPPALPPVTLNGNRQPSISIMGFVRVIAMLLVSIASIVVIAFVIYDTVFNENSVTEVADADLAPLLAQTLTPTQTYTPTWTPPPTRLPEENAGLSVVSGVEITLEMTQRSWVQITVDDVEQFVGILEPDDIQRYAGNQSVEINAANAAALAINFNGLDQPVFGQRGEQIMLDFTPNGVSANGVAALSPTPTATITPEPTLTSIPVALPTETSTPVQAAAANVQPSPTPLFFDSASQAETNTPVPTITPLFAVVGESNSEEANPTVASSDAEQVQPTAQREPTASTTPTETPSPTLRPTSNAVLPIRATPANPTPTKTGVNRAES